MPSLSGSVTSSEKGLRLGRNAILQDIRMKSAARIWRGICARIAGFVIEPYENETPSEIPEC